MRTAKEISTLLAQRAEAVAQIFIAQWQTRRPRMVHWVSGW